jgi:8-oxo-dGTP diphosphatase
VYIKPEDRKLDKTLTAMQKVGAAIVRDKKVLVVRKKTQNKQEYFMAGGKMEGDETQRQTLQRELDEELGVVVKHIEYIGSFEDVAVFEEVPIIIHAYVVEIEGDVNPKSEIKEYAWIDRNFASQGIPLSSIMATRVVPELVKKGLM